MKPVQVLFLFTTADIVIHNTTPLLMKLLPHHRAALALIFHSICTTVLPLSPAHKQHEQHAPTSHSFHTTKETTFSFVVTSTPRLTVKSRLGLSFHNCIFQCTGASSSINYEKLKREVIAKDSLLKW